jgi:sulfide dehydrogenase cytochrome subunit
MALAAMMMAASSALAEGGAANGPMLAQACAGCHGQAGAGEGAVPDLRGYDREAFLRTWAEFRANERPATIMNRIARGYTEAEVAALADYFASLE